MTTTYNTNSTTSRGDGENPHPPNIVHFNVGGTKYQVSRSLIEAHPDTMLAVLVSNRWQRQTNQNDNNDGKGGDHEIFIDRNGHRFQFVLDYMRDGQVHIPPGTSRNACLTDLEYFGFTDVLGANVVEEWQHSVKRSLQNELREHEKKMKKHIASALQETRTKMQGQIINEIVRLKERNTRDHRPYIDRSGG